MEGGGEGMVAIVQGLHDAGLAVTLLDGRYSYLPEQGHASAPYLGHNSPLALPQAHSSVETSTEIHKTSTSTQICDGRYASVYQTTHCSVVPTSPPVHLPEFPPQRAEPCRTQGNFEIGGSGRLDTYSPDRGLILDRRSSRAIESDSFAHSLRRYSLSSPQRTTSTELVERILSYTQAKHTPKSSRLSRSLRCLREKNLQTPQSPQISPNPSKNLPTCSRVSKHDVTKDVTNKWARNVSSLDKMKNYAMALPKTYKVTKYKDHQLNCTYDYLKSTDPPKLKPARSTEVRYLSDMTKCLRDTLRQFVDDKPTVCPRIRSRYSQHRRSCHAAQPTTSSDSNNMQIQASLPQAPTVSRSTTTPKCIPNCPKRQKVCPSCRQFLPCECKAKSLEEIKNRRHLEEIVRQWAEEIPVYANECPADKLKRECLARHLVDKVDIPRDDYDYDRKVRDEIQKCLDVMPMWNPGTEIEKDRFKNDLNDKLFNKLKGLQKDKFEREVSRWVDELPFDDSVTDKDRIKENIVNRLKQIALNRPLSDIDYRNALIDEEMDILHELPLRSADEEILRVLAENLADRLVGIPSYEIKQKPRMSYDSGEFERKGMRKISNLRPSDDSIMDEVVDNILIDKLVAKLDALDLTGFDLDDENFQDELRDTIEAWLDAAIERGDVYVDPENREEVLDILMGKLLNTGDPAVKERLERARLNEEKRRALEKLASSGGKDGNIGDIEDQEIGKKRTSNSNGSKRDRNKDGSDKKYEEDESDSDIDDSSPGKSKGGRYGDSKKDKTRDGRSDNDDYSKNGKSRNGHSDYNGNKRSRMSDGGSFDDSSQDKSKGGRYDKTKDGRSGDKTTQDKMTGEDFKYKNFQQSKGKDDRSESKADKMKDGLSNLEKNMIQMQDESVEAIAHKALVDEVTEVLKTYMDDPGITPENVNEKFPLAQDILNLYDILDVPNNTRENIKLAVDLAKNLIDINSQFKNETLAAEEMENETLKWLELLSEQNDVSFATRDKEEFTNKLLKLVKNMPKHRKRWSKLKAPQRSKDKYKAGDKKESAKAIKKAAEAVAIKSDMTEGEADDIAVDLVKKLKGITRKPQSEEPAPKKPLKSAMSTARLVPEEHKKDHGHITISAENEVQELNEDDEGSFALLPNKAHYTPSEMQIKTSPESHIMMELVQLLEANPDLTEEEAEELAENVIDLIRNTSALALPKYSLQQLIRKSNMKLPANFHFTDEEEGDDLDSRNKRSLSDDQDLGQFNTKPQTYNVLSSNNKTGSSPRKSIDSGNIIMSPQDSKLNSIASPRIIERGRSRESEERELFGFDNKGNINPKPKRVSNNEKSQVERRNSQTPRRLSVSSDQKKPITNGTNVIITSPDDDYYSSSPGRSGIETASIQTPRETYGSIVSTGAIEITDDDSPRRPRGGIDEGSFRPQEKYGSVITTGSPAIESDVNYQNRPQRKGIDEGSYRPQREQYGNIVSTGPPGKDIDDRFGPRRSAVDTGSYYVPNDYGTEMTTGPPAKNDDNSISRRTGVDAGSYRPQREAYGSIVTTGPPGHGNEDYKSCTPRKLGVDQGSRSPKTSDFGVEMTTGPPTKAESNYKDTGPRRSAVDAGSYRPQREAYGSIVSTGPQPQESDDRSMTPRRPGSDQGTYRPRTSDLGVEMTTGPSGKADNYEDSGPRKSAVDAGSYRPQREAYGSIISTGPPGDDTESGTPRRTGVDQGDYRGRTSDLGVEITTDPHGTVQTDDDNSGPRRTGVDAGSYRPQREAYGSIVSTGLPGDDTEPGTPRRTGVDQGGLRPKISDLGVEMTTGPPGITENYTNSGPRRSGVDAGSYKTQKDAYGSIMSTGTVEDGRSIVTTTGSLKNQEGNQKSSSTKDVGTGPPEEDSDNFTIEKDKNNLQTPESNKVLQNQREMLSNTEDRYTELQRSSLSQGPNAPRDSSYETIDSSSEHPKEFQTSTPRKGAQKNAFSPDLSSIQTENAEYTSPLVPNKMAEQQYADRLTEIIIKWANQLPYDLDTIDSKFKESMINDLVSDTIDRQKYLQVNPEAKITDNDQLEHLKYEVFKWLSRLFDIDDVTSMMPRTDSLMENIKTVPVPQLARPPDRSLRSKSPNSFDALQNEISVYIQQMYPHIYTPEDKKAHKKFIRDVANKIHGDEHEVEEVKKEVLDWLRVMAHKHKQHKTKQSADGTDITETTEESDINEPSIPTPQNQPQEVKVNKPPPPPPQNYPEPVAGPSRAEKTYSPLPQMKPREQTNTTDSYTEPMSETTSYYVDNIITEDTGEFITDNLTGAIMDWLKKLPLYQKRTPDEKRIQEGLVTKLGKSLKEVFESSQSSDVDVDELLIDEITKHIRQFPMDDDQQFDSNYHRQTAIQLLHYLKSLQMFQNISSRQSQPPEDYLTAIVGRWVNSIPMNARRTSAENRRVDDTKNSLLGRLKALRQRYDPSSKEYAQMVENEILQHLRMFPVSEDKKENEEYMINKAKELMKHLDVVPLETEPKRTSKPIVGLKPMKRRGKKAADILYENVKDWVDNLPLREGETIEEQEKLKLDKQNLISKIINKVGELNMNPETCNDTNLYDDLLDEELDKLLSPLPLDVEPRQLDALKKDLINRVREAKVIADDELAAKEYKRQLRDSVTKTLPTIKNPTTDEQASLNNMKDNLADAFINLHYVTDDDEKKQKYKKKISDEVSQFCDDYLKRYPGTPLDSAILNQELYKALQKVPLPTDDTMAQEVEELRMKDEINEWMNEIPFKDKSRPQQLHRNKMVPVLARRLHEIEMEKEENPGLDSDGKMQYEISRWLRKLPLQPDEGDIDITTDKLIEKLKRTESERKFFPSFRTQGKQSIDSTGNVIGAGFGFEPGIGFRNGMGADPMCPYFKTILDKRCDNACMTKPQIPPSTLSAQDRAHLERIRQRNAARNRSPCCACKDASVNPPPIDAGIQTDIGVDPQWPPKENVRLSQTTGVQLSPQPSEPNAIQQSSSAEAACGSCNQVSPQVIIKEYYWDSADTSKLQAAGFVPGSSQIPYDTQQQRVPCLSQQTPCTRSQSFLPQNRSFPTRPEFMIQSPLSCLNRQSPCPIPKSPCVSQHRMPSRNMPYTSTPKRTGLRPNRSQQFRQPCFAKPDLSQTPSCIESDYQDAGASRCPQPKVTRLGSFDNVPAEYHQMPNGTRDELNWSSIRLPSDNEDFMGTSYGRHRVCMPSDDELDESCVRERRQDKMRCRCKDTHTRSSARIRVSHRPSCQSCTDSSVRRCPKCCGTHCPYPSYLYFRQ